MLASGTTCSESKFGGDKSKEEAKSLIKRPLALRSNYVIFQELSAKLKLLNFVNERSISLIQTYNSALTKDETQKQHPLPDIVLRLKCMMFIEGMININNNKLSLFHNSLVADTPQTTSVMIYTASVHRKRFVYITSLNHLCSVL